MGREFRSIRAPRYFCCFSLGVDRAPPGRLGVGDGPRCAPAEAGIPAWDRSVAGSQRGGQVGLHQGWQSLPGLSVADSPDIGMRFGTRGISFFPVPTADSTLTHS
jgi:hypothetical protein